MASPKTAVSDIVDRRNESRRWMQSNYWDEWEDVYRAVKCRTKPIMVKDRAGNDVEDPSRTNVCMPELSLIRRRKVARLTANPPQINYVTPNGDNDPVSQKLTALAFMQFDRSGETMEHFRLVDSAVTFGIGYTKLIDDTIEVIQRLRKPILDSQNQPTLKTRGELLEFQGKDTSDMDDDALNTQLDDDVIKQLILAGGKNEIAGQQKLIKYAGPVAKNVFVGDMYLEPGCRTLNESGWLVEAYWETDVWLQKLVRQKYTDPTTGEERSVVDYKAAGELLDSPSPNVAGTTQQPSDLRTRLRAVALGQSTPNHPSRLIPGKRFDILESHQRDEYGQMWITYVGNEKVYLGKKPYPWDLYGRYAYTELNLLPDILNNVGDSTPRLFRWLHFLHNSTVGQRKDLVNAILRPIMLVLGTEDIPDEAFERRLMRLIQVKSLNSIRPMMEGASIGQALSSANEEEAQIIRMMSLAEPNLTNVESGTDTNPQAGKTATTAVLAAKSADALTQLELDGLNRYLKDVGEKKLCMNQQVGDQWNIPTKYVTSDGKGILGLSERGNKTSTIDLNWEEIQGDIQVEPAAASMLAVDDDIRRNAAMQFYQFSAQNPVTFNVNYAATFLASTIRGIDPDKAVNPPTPPPPPPPKFNVAVAVKWPELPPEIQSQLLQGAGAQITPEVEQELHESAQLTDVMKTSIAADAATNLHSPPEIPDSSLHGRILEADQQSQERESQMEMAKAKSKEPDTNLSRGVND